MVRGSENPPTSCGSRGTEGIVADVLGVALRSAGSHHTPGRRRGAHTRMRVLLLVIGVTTVTDFRFSGGRIPRQEYM